MLKKILGWLRGKRYVATSLDIDELASCVDLNAAKKYRQS